MMDALEFRSEDRAFGVSIGAETLTKVLNSCRDLAPVETGGYS